MCRYSVGSFLDLPGVRGFTYVCIRHMSRGALWVLIFSFSALKSLPSPCNYHPMLFCNSYHRLDPQGVFVRVDQLN